MTHSLTSYLGSCYLNAAALADLSSESDLLILSAVTLPVLGRSEDLFAEQAFDLGLLSAVVYGFGSLDHAVGPLSDRIGGCETYLYFIKAVEFH